MLQKKKSQDTKFRASNSVGHFFIFPNLSLFIDGTVFIEPHITTPMIGSLRCCLHCKT